MLCDDSTPLGDQKQPGNDSWLQADYSPAALAGESPGSARSATMAWEFFSGQAVTAQGQGQRHQLQGHYQEPCKEHCQQYRWQQGQGHPEEPSAEIAARVLNSVESWTSSASHAGLQHAASGGFTLQTQPGMYGSGFGHRVGTESSAAVVPGVSGVALLAGGHGQKRKAHQREVQQGQLDELDEAAVDQILAGSLAPPFMLKACRTDNDGSGCGAAHAGGQHMQLGDLASMTEVQAMAQHLLHVAAAAETKQPKKKQRTGYSSSSSRTVHRVPVPHAAHGPPQGSGLFAARAPAQGPSAAAHSLHASHGHLSKGPPRGPPLCRSPASPQRPHVHDARISQAPLPVTEAPSHCVTTRRGAPAAVAPAATRRAAPAAARRGTSRAAPAAAPAAAQRGASRAAPAAAAPANFEAAPAAARRGTSRAAPAAAPALQSEYQDRQVVWAKCRHCPWGPAIVSPPPPTLPPPFANIAFKARSYTIIV